MLVTFSRPDVAVGLLAAPPAANLLVSPGREKVPFMALASRVRPDVPRPAQWGAVGGEHRPDPDAFLANVLVS